MNFIIDIDDTLLNYHENKEYDEIWKRYKDAKPDYSQIEIVNELYKNGHKIILHTGRNWDKYEITKNQMAEFNINHHELVMGKPQGVYIDKDSYKNIEECLNDYNLPY